jgi:DNA mismatch repair protein MutS2
MEVPCTAVTALTESRQPATGRPARVSLPAAADAVHELNLLGCRVDDALAKVDKFLDSSTLNGLREVRIIHGIGTGTLMQSIREHLSRSPHVRSFHKGEPFAGGDGVTVVELAE